MHYILLLPLLLFGYLSNNHLSVSTYQMTLKVQKNQAKKQASALSIIHLSDLHNKTFGRRQSRLMKKIRALKPDLIVITGDLVDGAPHRHAAAFLREASRICPVYYVRGNHESLAGNFPVLKQTVSDCGVHLLVNRSVDFKKDGYTYRITGLDDPKFYGKDDHYKALLKQMLDHMHTLSGQTPAKEQKKMNAVCRDGSGADFRILLTHRPELFSLYSRYPYDLVLCGHAHGGQIRIPFTDGLYAPGQGIFPKYTSGAHTKNHTTEIISRGLGNSSFPLRLFNDPEIVHVQICLQVHSA